MMGGPETNYWPIISTAIGTVTLIVSALIGFIVKGALQTLRDLRVDHEKVRDDVAAVRLLVAGSFMTREEASVLVAKAEADAIRRMAEVERRVQTIESFSLERRHKE